jgi:hypothetical protein
MGQLYPGAGDKLQAAKQAIQTANSVIQGWNNGSRVGLLTFSGGTNGVGSPPRYDITKSNQTSFRPFWGGLTDNFTKFDDKLNPLTPGGSTPTYHALDYSEGEMLADNAGGRIPVFILLSDGVPTLSSERYSFADAQVKEVHVIDPATGQFRPIEDVRQDGGPGGAPDYFNGEPLADVMEEINALKTDRPEYIYHAIAIQGDSNNTFNPEVLQYVAHVGEGVFAEASNLSVLEAALEAAVQDSACSTPPSATQLTSFEAMAQGDDMLVTWQTVFEVDTQGFNLYRTTEEGNMGRAINNEGPGSEYEKVNSSLIPAQALTGGGALYEWLDEQVDSNERYSYLLEEVKNDSTTTLYEEEEEAQIPNQIFLPLLSSP